jgi:predicted TIM-barrel enzyme
MKNITVTVSDELYRQARRFAAEHDTTVTAMVRAILEDYAAGETDAERLLREEIELLAQIDARAARHVDEGFAESARDDLYRRDEPPGRAAA